MDQLFTRNRIRLHLRGGHCLVHPLGESQSMSACDWWNLFIILVGLVIWLIKASE